MKILFIIQGEGRGHLTQALSLRQKLMAEGHEIVGVLVGKSPARRLPDFFLNKIQSPVYPFESPNFLPTAKNKQVSLMRSVLYNVLRLHKYMGSIRYIDRMIRQTDADVVVNFYELLTGLTYLLSVRKRRWYVSPINIYSCIRTSFSRSRAHCRWRRYDFLRD